MCRIDAAQSDALEPVATYVEPADLRRIAGHLRDLASYLAGHDLEHEAAYVMMACGRVRAKLPRDEV